MPPPEPQGLGLDSAARGGLKTTSGPEELREELRASYRLLNTGCPGPGPFPSLYVYAALEKWTRGPRVSGCWKIWGARPVC